MSLDIDLIVDGEVVFSRNITHNLNRMAEEAGIYEALWRPHRLKPDYNIQDDEHKAESEFESKSVTYAKDIIEIVRKGLHELIERPTYYEQFNSSNGWGTYKHFLPFVAIYLEALKQYPNAVVKVDR